MKTYYVSGIQRRFVERHINRIQRKLQHKSIAQRIYRKLFPNRTALIVTVTFIGICLWLGLGAPVP